MNPFGNTPLVPPYRPPPPITVDAAEFMALRTIVMALVAELAGRHEASGRGTPQSWINYLAVCCQEAILDSKMTASDGRDLEGMRRRALEHVNHILGGVRFPKEGNDAH